ncbi:MAG: cysteine desulfurase [Firmicutes bacterium]|nr:cysteine desulfurase [Bacillota bacterium]
MIYFDNASTTAVLPEVADVMYESLKNTFGNPSSLHGLGFESEQKLNKARGQVSRAMGINEKNIYFTSGGTEANNTAVLGTALAYKNRGMRVVTQVTEHPSVADSFRHLEDLGFDVVYLPVDGEGHISLDELKNAVDKNTTLVSIMYVNNETGAIQPVDGIIKTVKEQNPDCKVHCDCVQAFCKHKLPTKADLISVSSHKIGGPKGVGALYIADGARVENLHFGGSQEKGLRPGTENLTGITGFGLAAELASKDLEKKAESVLKVKNELLKITELLPDVYVNGALDSPYILNLSFEGVKGEVLLHALEADKIYTATSSACSARLKNKLKIVDLLNEGRGTSALRLSFNHGNTVEEAEKVREALLKHVPMLRKFQPR